MFRLICALMLVLLITTPSFGQQSLVGTYKLVSVTVEVDGKPYLPMGKAPHGYLVFTPTHFIYFFTAENRKFGASVNEKAALLDSLVAYAGVYRIEGGKLIQTQEVAWSEGEKGKDRVTTLERSGNRLAIKAGPMPWPRDPSQTMINQQVWEKIE